MKPPESPKTEPKMPAIFVGHGSPMNAIEDNEFSRAWEKQAAFLPKPRAILCISAHWETEGTKITAQKYPKTIHDFAGFPRELYAVRYPAPGSPELARDIMESTGYAHISPDSSWGLDHGAWSVLRRMYPEADIPVVQLSLDRTKPPEFHYELGRALRPLRDRGILIVGSGNLVHNLRLVCFEDRAYDWALEFDRTASILIASRDHDPLIHYEKLGKAAELSIPTNEHFLPLLYILGVQEEGEDARFFAERVTYCSISMRSLTVGQAAI